MDKIQGEIKPRLGIRIKGKLQERRKIPSRNKDEAAKSAEMWISNKSMT